MLQRGGNCQKKPMYLWGNYFFPRSSGVQPEIANMCPDFQCLISVSSTYTKFPNYLAQLDDSAVLENYSYSIKTVHLICSIFCSNPLWHLCKYRDKTCGELPAPSEGDRRSISNAVLSRVSVTHVESLPPSPFCPGEAAYVAPGPSYGSLFALSFHCVGPQFSSAGTARTGW